MVFIEGGTRLPKYAAVEAAKRLLGHSVEGLWMPDSISDIHVL